MKDNSLDGHRGKVAVSDTRVTSAGSGKADLKPDTVSGSGATNFDDDYNEWELGIGDLIIDLDADIEKTNEKNSQHQNGSIVGSPCAGATTGVPGATNTRTASFSFLGTQSCGASAMSNSKSGRMNSTSSVNVNSVDGTSGSAGATVEHQATVDKGLKMKIKRKSVGSKFSEAKHEIVQSDTKSSSPHPVLDSATTNNCTQNMPSETKYKHSSSKGRTSSHREKKEKNRDRDKGSVRSIEVNGVVGSTVSPSLKITNSGVSLSTLSNSTPAIGVSTNLVMPNSASSSVSSSTQDTLHGSATPSTVCSSSMPNLTLKLETKYSTQPTNTVLIKQEDQPRSPPVKKMRADKSERIDVACSPLSPETRDNSTSTTVGTITEPECLGPCEPGTSVMLEGIVWQETEGGVLVVNVTWRGKTYVGTLLDCTKHDWAPPRFCESPTSDVDSKTSKGRGKRGRGSNNNNSSDTNNFNDTRTSIHSKLRNGKGRRTTANSNNPSNGFTVPSSCVP